MNQESPYERYLTDRATETDRPVAGATAVMERGRLRRRRRRAGTGAVLSVAVLLGGAVLGQGLRSDDDAEQINNYGAGIVESTLDWTRVGPVDGIGWTRSMVQTSSGTIYGLSTAPGTGGNTYPAGTRLFASSDAATWTETAGPEGVSLSAVTAADDTIYAVGTGTAGGSVRVATSTAPADGWTVTDLPLDLVAEQEGLPGELVVAGVEVAADDTTTVVAATVQLRVDAAEVLPDEADPNAWAPTAAGMERLTCGYAGSDGSTTTALADSPDTTDPADTAGPADFDNGGCDDSASREVRLWADLGFDPAVADLVDGQTRLFASDGTGGFTETVTLPGQMWQDVVAGPDGFWAFVSATVDPQDHDVVSEATHAWFSPDGIDWSAPPAVLPGLMMAGGLLDGQVHVLSVDWENQGATLFRLVSGTVEPIDVSEVLGFDPDGQRFLQSAEFGPLGLAVAIGQYDDDGPGRHAVLHTTDGVNFARTEIPEPPADMKQTVSGLTMSADAVKVRLNLYPADDLTGGPPVEQNLFVGTPR